MAVTDLIIVCVCIAADVVTGLAAAWLTHSFQSSKMREGMGHKLGELFAMSLMYGLQWGLPFLGVTVSINFVRYLTFYIVIMELTSIAENIIAMDPEMSGPFSKIMDTLREVLNKHE